MMQAGNHTTHHTTVRAALVVQFERAKPMEHDPKLPTPGAGQKPVVENTTRPIRTGFVALVGKPNVGKSTLLNAILEQKVAIVSHHPQTTRIPLRGILNRPDAQIVFTDTPGIHEPHHRLGHLMVKLAQQAIPDADIICFVVDISTPPSQLDEQIAHRLRRRSVPCILVLNKVDVRPRLGGPHLAAYRALGVWEMELAISARTGDGIPALVDELVQRLPIGQPLYPEDWVVDQSRQSLAAEMVREKVMRFTEQEVPHSIAVEVEEWEERQDLTYIRMSINVERAGQKGIIIGAGGSLLKRIGQAARRDIELMLGQRVYLDLWVKVRPNWRNDPHALNWLGYRLKDFS